MSHNPMEDIFIKETEYDDTFSECWKELTEEFFKCEALQEYKEESERELLDLFQLGQYEELQRLVRLDLQEPGSIWKDAQEKGISFTRVHVYHKPLSEYLKFELEAYKIQSEEGEEIRMVSFDQLRLAGLPMIQDFMLFDRKKALIPQYSTDNILQGAVLSQKDQVISELLQSRDVLLRESTPLKEFLFTLNSH